MQGFVLIGFSGLGFRVEALRFSRLSVLKHFGFGFRDHGFGLDFGLMPRCAACQSAAEILQQSKG